ncbi:MAG: riboflavin kinase [Candidatus Moraniibacteriota bacterium]
MADILLKQSGIVEKGQELGKPIGFPTANIPFDDARFSGTYTGKVSVSGKEYQAAIYANQRRRLLESHLLDFSEDLYGKEMTVTLYEKIAESKGFKSDVEREEFIVWAVGAVREYFL